MWLVSDTKHFFGDLYTCPSHHRQSDTGSEHNKITTRWLFRPRLLTYKLVFSIQYNRSVLQSVKPSAVREFANSRGCNQIYWPCTQSRLNPQNMKIIIVLIVFMNFDMTWQKTRAQHWLTLLRPPDLPSHGHASTLPALHSRQVDFRLWTFTRVPLEHMGKNSISSNFYVWQILRSRVTDAQFRWMVLQVGAFIQGLNHYLWILRSPLYRDRGFSNSPSTADASWFALCIPTAHIPPSTRIPGTSNESTRTHYLATLLDSYIAVLRLFYLVMNIDAASRRFLSSPAEGSVFPNEDRLKGGKR